MASLEKIPGRNAGKRVSRFQAQGGRCRVRAKLDENVLGGFVIRQLEERVHPVLHRVELLIPTAGKAKLGGNIPDNKAPQQNVLTLIDSLAFTNRANYARVAQPFRCGALAGHACVISSTRWAFRRAMGQPENGCGGWAKS